MAREILFRGKRIDNGEWVYGSLLGDSTIIPFGQEFKIEGNHIFGCDLVAYAVDSTTVNQYIGITTEEGIKVFEGDIVSEGYNRKSAVEFCTEDVASCGCCIPYFKGTGFKANNIDLSECFVVGNIYDSNINHC